MELQQSKEDFLKECQESYTGLTMWEEKENFFSHSLENGCTDTDMSEWVNEFSRIIAISREVK